MKKGHGLVAQSPQMLLYSTELKIKIRIVIILLAINPRALVDLKHNNQSKNLILVMCFHH